MVNSIDFYFTVSKEANMAHDKDCNPSECYYEIFKEHRLVEKSLANLLLL